MATRVLLVEDNDVYRSSLELLLGLQSGLEVVGAVGHRQTRPQAPRATSRRTWSSWTTACPGSTAPPRLGR